MGCLVRKGSVDEGADGPVPEALTRPAFGGPPSPRGRGLSGPVPLPSPPGRGWRASASRVRAGPSLSILANVSCAAGQLPPGETPPAAPGPKVTGWSSQARSSAARSSGSSSGSDRPASPTHVAGVGFGYRLQRSEVPPRRGSCAWPGALPAARSAHAAAGQAGPRASGQRPGRQEFQEQRQEIRHLAGAELQPVPGVMGIFRSTIAWPRSRLSPCTCSNKCSDRDRVRSNSSP